MCRLRELLRLYWQPHELCTIIGTLYFPTKRARTRETPFGTDGRLIINIVKVCNLKKILAVTHKNTYRRKYAILVCYDDGTRCELPNFLAGTNNILAFLAVATPILKFWTQNINLMRTNVGAENARNVLLYTLFCDRI